MEAVYLSIGSNLGNRRAHIKRAIEFLSENSKIEIKKVSKLYEFDALTLDETPQPPYLNGAIAIETNLSPQALLSFLKKIEKKLGRTKTKKRWQPRPIDIDILFYGNQTIKEKNLTIPHPELSKRDFVLKPLTEVRCRRLD